MRFIAGDPELRQQLMGVLMVAAAAPGFWEFIRWVCSAAYSALTGKRQITNKDLSDRMDQADRRSAKMQDDITAMAEESRAHYEENLEERAKNNRSKILRFDDELRIGIKHSYEYFEDILRTVKEYEDYCDSHPKFMNRQAESAISHIQHAYDEAHENNSFI
jgi:hypothetical protein